MLLYIIFIYNYIYTSWDRDLDGDWNFLDTFDMLSQQAGKEGKILAFRPHHLPTAYFAKP